MRGEHDTKAPAAMSIDVEDWFHAENLKPAIEASSWNHRESRVERNVERMLERLADHETAATFFVLGWVAERFPDIARKIAGAGHEVASHGTNHELVYSLSPRTFREDVRRSKEVLEQQTGSAVRGYRAPCFSITDWAIDILHDLGFTYDSSFFPVAAHDRYGSLDGLNADESIQEIRSGGFYEVCLSSLGIGLPLGGGGYFRLYPYALFRMGVARILRSSSACVFYIHPWEIDPGQPRVRGLTTWRTFRHYVNLDRCEERWGRLLRDVRWTTVSDLLQQHIRARGS